MAYHLGTCAKINISQITKHFTLLEILQEDAEGFSEIATDLFTPICIKLYLVTGFRCQEMTVSSFSRTDDVPSS